jgi:outer membrane protein insertion porin family
MRYRFCLVVLASLFFWLQDAAFGQEPVRVIVLPFEIHAREDISYLQMEIPKLLKRELTEEGAVVLDPAAASNPNWREQITVPAGLRELGIDTGADSLIWGSLTRIGNKYSLDARMISPFEEETNSFFLQGEGIENLIGSVRDLARSLSQKLFKRAKVAKIVVEGNSRIESDAIERVIKTKPGDLFLPKDLSADLKSVYAMGYFEDIRIEAEDSPEGKIVTFHVQEKPTIRNIAFSGNKVFKDEEIRENLTIKAGSILNIFQIQNNIRRIEELYKGKNYHNIQVSYKILERERNVADLQFSIDEGQKIMIREIDFVGNEAFPDKDLKKIMKTSEKGFFSFITSSGELNKEELNQDVNKLSAFYQNRGYIQAIIGEPQLEYRDNWIHVTIKVEEGPRFKVGKTDVSGDLVKPKEELLSKLKISKEKFYNRETLRSDVLALTDIYSDEGYAYANVSPRIDRKVDELAVDITFEVQKGKQAYFEKINISGNTKTRDKVIRRELDVYEQELYSGRRLKRGVRNLYRLDFFEDIKVNTPRGSTDEQMILDIEVKEKPTGAFSFGGGYSSIDSMFLVANVTQRNLFGKAQRLDLGAHLGGRTTQYTLSFTEPWLFDIPLSAGFDVYDLNRDYDTYDKDAQGGMLRFGYPIYDFTRVYLSYRFERADIRNVTSDAARSIRELEGFNIQSSMSASVQYDSRDRVFNPTEGADHSLTVEYAGLGGDIGFLKLIGDTGWYIPLFWETVGFVHGRAGVVRESADKILPDYEKFYMGGIRTLRGYDWQDISLLDEEGAKIGGEKFVQFNLEYIFPLVKKAGLSGVAFFDTGNVYASDEEMDLGSLFMSAGGGVRWYSPIGPIRLEWGYPLNPDEGMRNTGRWEFSMGGSFW